MNLFRTFMELDEVYNDRQVMIDDIRRAGKNYNFNKYTDAQIYRIWQRLKSPVPATKEPKHELDLDFEPITDSPRCECGALLSDAGFCPVCYDGEEDLDEGIFDTGPVNRTGFVTASGQQVKLPKINQQTSDNITSTNSPAASQSMRMPPPSIPDSNKSIVCIVSDKGRLRAISNDGEHGVAFVAFPNNLRQYEGQRYEVDQLIWNGKNYRVAGNIVKI